MAAIEPAATLEPTTAAEEDGLNEFDDPEHPSFWEEKLKPNPAYQGPADVAFNKNSQGPDRKGNTKLIRYYFNPRTQKKMPYEPNFYTWKKARRYAKTSCFFFKDTNPFRKTLVKIVTSPYFENFILFSVLLNTLMMMIPNYNYKFVNPKNLVPYSKTSEGCCPLFEPTRPKCVNDTSNPDSPCYSMSCARAQTYENICCPCPPVNMVAFSDGLEWTFLIIFLIEMILKMVAFGVFPGPASWYGAYLTDSWNILDFIIVVAALASAPYPFVSSDSSTSFNFIRVIRVLRPLRSLAIIPSMRRMVQTLLVSFKQLTAVFMLLSFIFLIFGALMIQIYAGQLRYTCRLTNFPLQLPMMQMDSEEYTSSGVGWLNAPEVNWCTYRDDWDPNSFWTGLFPSCNWTENVYANTRKSTMQKKVFYHKLEEYPTNEAGKFKTQYFYFNTTSAWHHFHRELLNNASALAKSNDPYRFSAIQYESDLLNSTGVFKPCHDEDGITIPISFEQCNRVCYNKQVDEQSRRYSVCDAEPNSARCKTWTNRPFDRHDPDNPMCSKYCPDDASSKMSQSWDVQSLTSPNSGLNSPWRNVSSESFPFYTDHRYCFWPNDHDGDARSTANRLCSGWFTSVYDGATGHNMCPAEQYCGSDFDATGNLRFHGYDIVNAGVYKEDLLWGIPQFNNFAQAFVSILQSITLEGWVDILYTVADRTSYVATAAVFVLMVFIGGLFLLNMVLAVIADSFSTEQEKSEEKRAAIEKEKKDDPRAIAAAREMKEKPVRCVQKSCLCCGIPAPKGHKHSKNSFYRHTYSFVRSPAFELFILICIIINFLTVCLDFYRAPFFLEQILDYVNFFLTAIFVVEMVLKLIGLGPRDYFKNNWNNFDFFIVIFSIIEYILSPPTFISETQTITGVNLKVLRTFRVFRVFKLAKEWKQLSLVLRILGKSMLDVVYFVILLFIFIIIFAVWALQSFANVLRFDPVTGRPVPLEIDPATGMATEAYATADVPSSNFDSMWSAFVTVFQVCSGENWNTVMYDGMRSTGWQSVFFFLVMILLLVMVVLELFVAIVLGHFEALADMPDKKKPDEEQDEQDGEDETPEQEEEREVERCCCCFLIGPKPAQEEPDPLSQLSCCSRSKKNSGVVAPEEQIPDANDKDQFLLSLKEVNGPLKRFLASCGADDRIVEFYCHGIKEVKDFKSVTNELLDKINLTQKQREAVLTKAEMPTPTGLDLTTFEERTMLNMRKLQNEKVTSNQALENARLYIQERKKAGDTVTPQQQAEHNFIITDAKKRINKIEKELALLEAKLTPMNEKALYCIPRNKCRIALNRIVEHPWFDTIILICILCSTALLMAETPIMKKPGHWVDTFFKVFDWLFAWIFILEMVFKIFAKGFLMHKHSYLRNYWNVLDFAIVCVSIVLMTLDVIDWAGVEVGDNFLSALRALRAFRALRPLRSIRRFPELRVIVLALLGSIPDVLQTFAVVIIFLMVFSVAGVNFYKGGFRSCEFGDATDAMMELEKCAPKGQFTPNCTLWTDLTSTMRVDYMAGSSNEVDKNFTEEYNRALETNFTMDWNDWNSKACDLSLYISNSVTNWTKPGPLCTMKMTGERLFGEYEYSYHLMANKNTYLRPTSKTICEWMGGSWELYEGVPQSFNNVLVGLMAWFEFSTTEGWVDAMYAAADYRAEDMEPNRLNPDDYDEDEGGLYLTHFWVRYFSSTLFFVFFILFGAFLLANMFVGTVCGVFQNMRMHNDNQAVFLTESQKEWQRRQKTVMRLQPFLKPRPPDQPVRGAIFNFTTSEKFDQFIISCIAINTVIMTIKFFPVLVPQYWQLAFATEITNIIFAIIFALEALFKIIGMGQQYFCKKDCRSRKKDQDGVEQITYSFGYADAWNIFDFVIVVGTIFGLIINYSSGVSGINNFTTIIRTFRVARIFRLIKHPFLKKLKSLMATIALSIPSIVNLALVMILLMAIFAILGVQLFATVGFNDALNDWANFQHFPIAMLTLFRGTTGENWNGLMHSISRNASTEDCTYTVPWNKSVCGFCQWNEFYMNGDPLNCINCTAINGCGMHMTSEVFFLIYTFFVTFMIMNIFVAVILEAYEQSALDESAIVTEEDLAIFQMQWSELDTTAIMSIPLVQLPELMDQLPFPMGFKEPEKKMEKALPLPEAYTETNRCLMSAPNLEDSDDEDQPAVRKFKMHKLMQHQKQRQIDEMDIHSYQEEGIAQVRFRDVLFACVQRAYQQGDPSTAFRIDNAHQEVLQDETKAMQAVPIKTSHYLSALRIAQAYRAHKFRNHFIGLQMTAEQKRDTPEAFADSEEHAASGDSDE